MTRTTVLLATSLYLGLIAAGCEGSSGLGASYADEIQPLLSRSSAVDAAWSQAAEAAVDADFSTLSLAEINQLVVAELDAARAGLIAHREVGEAMEAIVPPELCEEVHANYVESNRLGERAFGELYQYSQRLLGTGRPDNAILEAANSLLADVDRVKGEGVLLEAPSECS